MTKRTSTIEILSFDECQYTNWFGMITAGGAAAEYHPLSTASQLVLAKECL